MALVVLGSVLWLVAAASAGSAVIVDPGQTGSCVNGTCSTLNEALGENATADCSELTCNGTGEGAVLDGTVVMLQDGVHTLDGEMW